MQYTRLTTALSQVSNTHGLLTFHRAHLGEIAQIIAYIMQDVSLSADARFYVTTLLEVCKYQQIELPMLGTTLSTARK